jgi:hypothetical protein
MDNITIVLNMNDYPAFRYFKNPTQMIMTLIEREHSILNSQHSAVPTTQSTEVLDIVKKALDNSRTELKEGMRKIEETNDKIQHTATEIRSTGEILRSNASEFRTFGQTMASSVSGLKAMEETLKELPVMLSKSQTKGSIGEVCVSTFLKESLSQGDFTIESTSTTSRSGDIRVTRRDFECMIDTKFYKHTVPKKEMEKLRRDMSERKVQCGMLLSLTSGVSGFKSIDMDVYADENDKISCVLVLSDVKDKPERVLIGMKILELVWESFLKKNAISSSSLAIREKSISVLQNIMESSEDLRDLVKQFEKHKKTIFEGLSSFHEYLVKTVEKHIARVEEKLAVFSEC